MRICRWFRRLALNAILLLALPVAVLAPVSAAPTSAALGTLSVDGSDPAASEGGDRGAGRDAVALRHDHHEQHRARRWRHA
jgi:hypothetical protein